MFHFVLLKKIEEINITKSKEFYETFRTSNEIYHRVESILRNDDWTKTYKSLHKGLCSELRSFNYRILFGALYTKDKFKYRNKKDMDCLLCKMKKESIIHVYTECEYTNSIFNDFCKVNNIVRVNNFDDIIYLKSDSAEEREKISIFKLIIWKMRMREPSEIKWLLQNPSIISCRS